MLIQERDNPFGIAPDAFDLVFAKSEIACLRRASALMSQARERCERQFGRSWVDSDADDILAYAEHAFVDFIEDGQIEVWVQ